MNSEIPAWIAWARRARSIAESGLTYASNPFDLERYRELQALAAEIVASHTAATAESISGVFAQDAGYATPKLDVRAVVFRDDAILLVRERSDGCWTLPGGWVDVGQSPSEAVVKEVREESGFEVRPLRLLAVLDRDRHGHPALLYSVWKVFLLCEIRGGAASAAGIETDAVGFFRENEIPPLSLTRVMPSQISRMFAYRLNPELPADFD